MNEGMKDTMDYRYDGKIYNKLYAITITSRRGMGKGLFQRQLTKFLSSIEYPALLKGNVEYHEKKDRCAHLHGLTSWGRIPKGNKQNEFTFTQKQIVMGDTININQWYDYCYKQHRLNTIVLDW